MFRNHHISKHFNIHRKGLIICLLLLTTVIGVYWPVRNYDLINYDDNVYVTQNPILRKGLTIEGVIVSFSTPHATYWIPLTWLSYLVDAALFGTDPGAHHITNLLFHIVNSLLVFFVFKKRFWFEQQPVKV